MVASHTHCCYGSLVAMATTMVPQQPLFLQLYYIDIKVQIT